MGHPHLSRKDPAVFRTPRGHAALRTGQRWVSDPQNSAALSARARTKPTRDNINLGSRYIPNYSHSIGIMIINHWV